MIAGFVKKINSFAAYGKKKELKSG